MEKSTYYIVACLLCLTAIAPARASVVLMVGLSKAMPAWQTVVLIACAMLIGNWTVLPHQLNAIWWCPGSGLRADTLLCTSQTGNYSFDPLPDMPADFGPRVPAEGVEGILVVCIRALSPSTLAPLQHQPTCRR